MNQITWEIIKQYMWYYNRFKIYDHSKFIIILHFQQNSMNYVIYKNITDTQLKYEKQNYFSYPFELKNDSDTYFIFSFENEKKDQIINTLRKYYKIFFINVDSNKIWNVDSQYLNKFKNTGFINLVSNNIFNILNNILYESEIIEDNITPLDYTQNYKNIIIHPVESVDLNNNNISSDISENFNSVQISNIPLNINNTSNDQENLHILKNIPESLSKINIQNKTTEKRSLYINLNKESEKKNIIKNVVPKITENVNKTDSLQSIITELIQTKPKVIVNKNNQQKNTQVIFPITTTPEPIIENTNHNNKIIYNNHNDDDDMILYEEIDTQTSISTIKTESEKVLKNSKPELFDFGDEFVERINNPYNNIYTSLNTSNKENETIVKIDINPTDKNYTDVRFGKKLKFKKITN